MNEIEKKYFQALIADRADSAKTMKKPSMKGIRGSVVEKYSDQAHFIYELLQNADDAKATNARFTLLPDRLVFAHDGTRLFSITDPANEEQDSQNGTLGDINAITSIGNSNKTEASIGKFGVGFKAVFQYTRTPHIFDPNFRFKIEQLFVPQLLENDYPGRKKDETLFVFPFDLPSKLSTDAHNDIANKLKSLSYPLLFLTRLKYIEFEIGKTIGLYEKKIEDTIIFDDIVAERICLTQNSGEDIYSENLWLFSRNDEHGRRYSVGFFLDSSGKLLPVNKTAFCFFPTKEVTGLSFIIHAPFLLTDSREGIRAGVPYNDNMIKLLSDLAADSLACIKAIGDNKNVRLIDDSILNIVPINENAFSSLNDRSRVSFRPFFHSLKNALANGLLPTETGYASKEYAYWSDTVDINRLFSDEQLTELIVAKASWVFKSYGRNTTSHNAREGLQEYIDSLTHDWINEGDIFRNISGTFISQQSVEWLHSFYSWLGNVPKRFANLKTRAIFLNTERKPVPAYDSKGHLILFLPVNGIDGYETILPDLLINPDTAEFIKQVGITEPSMRDSIYTKILPKYKNGHAIPEEADADFVLLLNYYLKCPQEEVESYISTIKDYQFIKYTANNASVGYDSASNLYYPSPDVLSFMEHKPSARFADFDHYLGLIGASREKELRSFLVELGVKIGLQIVYVPVDYDDDIRISPDLPKSKNGYKWNEYVIDGCKELLRFISTNLDADKSELLWNSLIRIVEEKCNRGTRLSSLLKGRCEYFYYSQKSFTFESSTAKLLKSERWMADNLGNFVEPGALTQDTMSDIYNVSSPYADELFEFFGIKKSDAIVDVEDPNLSDSQRAKIKFANEFSAAGININDPEMVSALIKSWKSSQEPPVVDPPVTSPDPTPDPMPPSPDPTISRLGKKKQETVRKIVSRVNPDDPSQVAPAPEPAIDNDEDIDSDEWLPKSVDYSKKIEQAMQKSAAEISRITQLEDLQNRAASAKKYSFAWFNALLELEALNSGEESSNSREVSISFSKVELAEGSQRTLILKHPSRYIPQFMEELADIPLVLHMGDTAKTLAIEVASIKSYSLHVKLKSHVEIQGIDFSKVQLATIDAKSPVFLTEALKKEFAALGKPDDYDMQANLCSNIEFVFGPPGTGKTTYLAREVLIPLMQRHSECRVLVLTPTNKSADVLIKKIMDAHGEDHSYEKWLIRFGGTADETIEESPVLRDKTFDIMSLAKSVTVTTMARFPYDYFMPHGRNIMLNSIYWDYIVIDEASMIPIANIVYPLYKKTPKKFIIAGDPFQIEPIASVDAWKDENVYKMVHLDSFKEPKTIPHQYDVKLLTMQYRSVPEIGEVFSRFAYDGILKHHRESSSQRGLHVGNDLGIETLNIIKYPVSKYESIYRSKRLQHSSSYQIYSALFTYEYICYLAKAIAENNRGSKFTIGVIAPYRAQASLIDKLLAAENLPKEVDVSVGTIHGFQGDECDIVFAVLNTPPSISRSQEMFLNKLNIINVSISRARDCLFIVMPDDDTENIENLTLVKRVERLIHQQEPAWNENDTHFLESVMFDNPNYLEENAFSTGHQNVNVYGLPEKCYEIRSEDNAVDIQVHKAVKQADMNSGNANGMSAVPELEPSIEAVPERLRDNAVSVVLFGALEGKGILAPYSGKLKDHTLKPVEGMLIPVKRSGKQKVLPVSVCTEDHIIYIAFPSYKSYEEELHAMNRIELRKPQ